MNILAVDTSALTASVALMQDGQIITGELSFTTKLTHSQTLMPMIDELLRSTNLNIKDIDRFALSTGPGSFTGLRIGIGTIKGLSYGLDKGVVCVNTLEALAHNVSTSPFLICPIMDARRSQVYNALYRSCENGLLCIEEPRALSIEELCLSLNEKTIFVGDGVRVYKDTITSLMKDKAVFAPPQHCLQRAASVAFASLYKEETPPECVTATYLRKPQAERERIG